MNISLSSCKRGGNVYGRSGFGHGPQILGDKSVIWMGVSPVSTVVDTPRVLLGVCLENFSTSFSTVLDTNRLNFLTSKLGEIIILHSGRCCAR